VLDRERAGSGYAARMALQLVYETHAITTDNEAGIATGWLPGELSARGRETAAELGARRRNDGLAAAYVSDLARAVETARIAFEGSTIPIQYDARLRECNYGRMNGSRNEDQQPQRVNHIDVPWPGGESYNQVVTRTAALLYDLVRQWDGSRVLLIAHSANRWSLDHLLLGRDLRELTTAEFDWQPGWEYVVPTDWR
jgi:broad specificity phosphatase PhoE